MGKRDDVSSVAQVARVQILRGVERTQDLCLGAVRSAVKATADLPVRDLPPPSRIPGVPSLDAATRFTFDFAAELLSSSRDFATRLTTVIKDR